MFSDWLQRLPRPVGRGGRYLFLLSLFGFSALFLAAFVSQQWGAIAYAPYLVASMGAATVLMFAAPNSPMATPWAFVGGNLFSAAVGVSCVKLFGSELWVAPLAVSSAILLMHFLRCQHPPGGASALFAVIGGESIHQLGYLYLLKPVGINVLIFALVVLIYRTVLAAINERDQQDKHLAIVLKGSSQMDTFSQPPEETEAFNQQDLQRAIQQSGLFLDISEAQLLELFNGTLHFSRMRQHERTLCVDLMHQRFARVAYGDSLYDCWQQMQHLESDFAVVADKAGFVEGIVYLTDILALLDLQSHKPLYAQIRKGLKSSGGLDSQHPEVAGQLMLPMVQVAAADRLLDHTGDSLAPVMAVVDGRARLQGVIDWRQRP